MTENGPSSSSKIPEKYRGGVSSRGRSAGGSASAGQNPSRSLSRALVLVAIGLVLALAAAVADAYLHRGIETSANPPFVLQVSGRDLATNVDLSDFPSVQVETIAGTLRANGFRYVRHPFLWSDIEPNRGQFNWEPYDAIITALDDAGLETVAVISGTPAWARSPEQVDSSMHRLTMLAISAISWRRLLVGMVSTSITTRLGISRMSMRIGAEEPPRPASI